MKNGCHNRLLIVGRAKDLQAFEEHETWLADLGGKHPELLECPRTRRAWQFETDAPPLQPLKRLAARWPLLTFVLDYDQEQGRSKGLARARGGKLKSYWVGYEL